MDPGLGWGRGAVGWVHSGHACKCRACVWRKGPWDQVPNAVHSPPRIGGLSRGTPSLLQPHKAGPLGAETEKRRGPQAGGEECAWALPLLPRATARGCRGLSCGSLLTCGTLRADVSEEVPKPGHSLRWEG